MVRESLNWKPILLWFLVYSLIVLIIAIIIASIINLWPLVYAVLLLSPALTLVELLNLFNVKLIDKQIEKHKSKKVIIWFSIGLFLFRSILLVAPFIIGLLVDFLILNIFNVYMMIAFFCVSLIFFNVLLYLDSKGKLKTCFFNKKEK